MSKALLEIQNLHVRVEEKEILHGVDLTVGQDETHVLMGPNGTGKSTLGYAITGNPTYSVTGGSIIFNGKDITELPVNERAKKGSAPSSAAHWSRRPATACACGTSRKSSRRPWRF